VPSFSLSFEEEEDEDDDDGDGDDDDDRDRDGDGDGRVSYFFPRKGTQQKDFSASNLKDANDAPSFIESRGHISYFSSF